MSSTQFPNIFLGLEIAHGSIEIILLLFTLALWFISFISTPFFEKNNRKHSNELYVFMFMSMLGNIAVILFDDLISFYFAFALMNFAAYGMIIHKRDKAAIDASRVYIFMVILGESLLLPGLWMLHNQYETLSIQEVRSLTQSLSLGHAFIFAGFGIKLGLIPLHIWLPLAHPASPTTCSAVLSGSIIKAGIIGLIKLIPFAYLSGPTISTILIIWGVGQSIMASLYGITQKDPKTVLAYSSVSQMGLAVCLLGIALQKNIPETFFIITILFFIIHHGVTKSALFLAVGHIKLRFIKGKVNQSATSIIIIAMTLLCVLSLIGMPFTSGGLAKNYIKQLLLIIDETNTIESSLSWVKTLITLTTFTTSFLMIHFFKLLYKNYFQKTHLISDKLETKYQQSKGYTSLLLWVTMSIMTGPIIYTIVSAISKNHNATQFLIADIKVKQSLIDTFIPFLIGLIAAVWIPRIFKKTILYKLPEGDLGSLLNTLIQKMNQTFSKLNTEQDNENIFSTKTQKKQRPINKNKEFLKGLNESLYSKRENFGILVLIFISLAIGFLAISEVIP